ncbi:DNA repair exonuclease [Burkholderia sp. Ch1-1]|uniref:DNA repair exonuclease n=1 Tax=Paraburkholderia dioscoreae TaxID=2604047 RepID=A0A5Q4Z3D3_9BURK|nr:MULTISPECIES: DNA repair exonuclease [Paraburkholderia]EIF34226.1 DNA repair exonuclease [Burkholderia sp. Ch1-1]MDR8401435.1 DNA repair exonuclease [Paraburkholderia sp. USG1]VVD33154.1 DNA repair exonuclease [Paraburkholderia dioscoreae]
MIRFLHTADWQIGTQFGQFEPDEAAHLAEARFETVRRIAGEAAARKVDAVLVAGDVFDLQTVSDTVIRRLFGALQAFTGPWIMLPGNHDAALVESVWTRAQRLNCIAPNVRVVLEPGVVLLDACRCALLCAPLTQRITYDDTTGFFDTTETPAGYHRVGLAHGSVSGILQEGIDSSNPIAPTRAASARLDYLALGDWHGHLRVDERTWYAGTHEQDRFRANDPGFMLDVTLQEPGAAPVVEPVRVGQYQWHRWDETISVPTDVDSLKARLATLGSHDVLRVTVGGTAALADAEAIHVAVEEARARVRALRVDLSGLQVLPTADDLAELGAQSGYLAKVVARLRGLQEDPQSDPREVRRAAEALLLLARFQRELPREARSA